MARHIDAVKTADIISEKLNIPLGDLVDVFAEIPTADVVVAVRCRDCKHYVSDYCTRDIKGRTNMFYMAENDFCSYGERGD